MSQESSLTQSGHSVRQALTAYTGSRNDLIVLTAPNGSRRAVSILPYLMCRCQYSQKLNVYKSDAATERNFGREKRGRHIERRRSACRAGKAMDKPGKVSMLSWSDWRVASCDDPPSCVGWGLGGAARFRGMFVEPCLRTSKARRIAANIPSCRSC